MKTQVILMRLTIVPVKCLRKDHCLGWEGPRGLRALFSLGSILCPSSLVCSPWCLRKGGEAHSAPEPLEGNKALSQLHRESWAWKRDRPAGRQRWNNGMKKRRQESERRKCHAGVDDTSESPILNTCDRSDERQGQGVTSLLPKEDELSFPDLLSPDVW